jgi:hypothetical protein
VRRIMTNLLERAIDCNDADDAAEMIWNALGIESDRKPRESCSRRGRCTRCRDILRPSRAAGSDERSFRYDRRTDQEAALPP